MTDEPRKKAMCVKASANVGSILNWSMAESVRKLGGSSNFSPDIASKEDGEAGKENYKCQDAPARACILTRVCIRQFNTLMDMTDINALSFALF